MTTAMMNRAELNNEELDMVNGGVFTKNTFKVERYHEAGIRTEYHAFTPDEFWLPDGTKTNMTGANAYILYKYGYATFSKWEDENSSDPRIRRNAQNR